MEENIKSDTNDNVCKQIESFSEKYQLKYVEENEHFEENIEMISNAKVYKQMEISPDKCQAKYVENTKC